MPYLSKLEWGSLLHILYVPLDFGFALAEDNSKISCILSETY